jgi:AraC-like DNA-binding protein
MKGTAQREEARTSSSLAPGFHVAFPHADVPEIAHVGERWMSGFRIDDHAHGVWEFYLQLSGRSQWSAPDEDSARLWRGLGLSLARELEEAGDTARPMRAGSARGREWALEEGGFLAVAPGVPHAMRHRTLQTQHFLYAAFDLEAVLERHPTLKPWWKGARVVFRPQAQPLLGPLRQLMREVSADLPARAVGMRLALDALVVEATRLLAPPALGSAPSLVLKSEFVARARELLDAQPARAWTLRDLGRLTGVSPGHLAERFSKEVGCAPGKYLLAARIERAKELLERGLRPTDVAREIGFCSSQHFATTFKKATGKTPREWSR